MGVNSVIQLMTCKAQRCVSGDTASCVFYGNFFTSRLLFGT